MLLVDNQGPKGAFFVEPLVELGLPAVEQRLDYGDLAFAGKGAKKSSVMIGIEFKRLDSSSTDIVQSLRSGRLAGHQLPGMLGEDGLYDHAWLLVEGEWRHTAQGQIEVKRGGARGRGQWIPIRGGMSAVELEKQLLTMELCGGLHVRFTNNRRDSCRFIGALYHWWTDVALDKHTSHLAVHNLPSLITLSPFRAAICKWPGIERRVSKVAEEHFEGSTTKAAAASVNEWAELCTTDDSGSTRRFGAKNATRLVNFLADGRKKR